MRLGDPGRTRQYPLEAINFAGIANASELPDAQRLVKTRVSRRLAGIHISFMKRCSTLNQRFLPKSIITKEYEKLDRYAGVIIEVVGDECCAFDRRTSSFLPWMRARASRFPETGRPACRPRALDVALALTVVLQRHKVRIGSWMVCAMVWAGREAVFGISAPAESLVNTGQTPGSSRGGAGFHGASRRKEICGGALRLSPRKEPAGE